MIVTCQNLYSHVVVRAYSRTTEGPASMQVQRPATASACIVVLACCPAGAAVSNKTLSRSSSCPPDKCPADAPWLSTVTLGCYPEQTKSYYIYCNMSASASEATTTFLQLTSLQCNEGYEGRLCASCSRGYGLQVRTCALLLASVALPPISDPDVCREKFVGLARIPRKTGFLPSLQCCSAWLSLEHKHGSLSGAPE